MRKYRKIYTSFQFKRIFDMPGKKKGDLKADSSSLSLPAGGHSAYYSGRNELDEAYAVKIRSHDTRVKSR